MAGFSCILEDPSLHSNIHLELQWSRSGGCINPEATDFTVVHVIVRPVSEDGSESGSEGTAKLTQIANIKLQKWLRNILCLLPKIPLRGISLIIPEEPGYMIQCDFLEERLRGSQRLHQIQGFTDPKQYVQPMKYNGPASIHQLVASLDSAIGGIVLEGNNMQNIKESQRTVETELENRISFPWLAASPIAPKRLALVGESRPYHFCARMFHVAFAMGIELVVLESSGHWLEEDRSTYSHLREAFIPIDMTTDQHLADRIASAVRAYPYPIDGVTTVTEYLLLPTSQAAERLSMPTSPSTAFAKTVNKYETRVADGSTSCLLVSNVDEFRAQLSSSSPFTDNNNGFPAPPWIVKPCNGWASLNVIKANTEEGLVDAVERVSAHTAYAWCSPTGNDNLGTGTLRNDVIIEEYCNGPEIDVNFVLCCGKVLFSEVVDNFPCAADEEDTVDGTGPTSFKETTLVFPSALPPEEKLELRRSLHQAILVCGYDTGVFHVEARMRNSSMVYRRGREPEISLDLRPRLTGVRNEEPSTFLIEINARPPGYFDTRASALANGVDLFAMQLLLALPNDYRVTILSQPFQKVPTSVVVSSIQAGNSGTVMSDQPWRDLRKRNPELMAHVCDFTTNFRKGDIVADPRLSTTRWLAAFIAYTSEERGETLRIAAEVKQQFDCEIA